MAGGFINPIYHGSYHVPKRAQTVPARRLKGIFKLRFAELQPMRHVLNFQSSRDGPMLTVRDGREVSQEKMEGKRIAFFSPTRSCIGYRKTEGFAGCANNAIHVMQCPTCSARDISRAFTVGDFSGYPELYEECKKQSYSLYLAAFGEDIIKCGITRHERLVERWIEQGADMGCEITRFLGPDAVYAVEETVQNTFGFTNAVRNASKLSRLSFDHNRARRHMENAIAKVEESGLFEKIAGELTDLSEHYPAAASARVSDSIEGKVMGAKGSILFYEKAGGHFAVNMRDKIGRFILDNP
jgi:hypothetical protein